MKTIKLYKKYESTTSCLEAFGKHLSTIITDDFEVQSVRGELKDAIDTFLMIHMIMKEEEYYIELCTTQDGELINLQTQTSNSFKEAILPFLSPSQIDIDILLYQEEQLQYITFSSLDALLLMQTIIKNAQGPIAVQIVREHDQSVICQYIPDEKSTRNIIFAMGKRNMSLSCGHSSLLAYCQNKMDHQHSEYIHKIPEYICGAGAFPIRVNNSLVATVSTSGLHYGLDHDVIIQSINEVLNKNVPLTPSVIR